MLTRQRQRPSAKGEGVPDGVRQGGPAGSVGGPRRTKTTATDPEGRPATAEDTKRKVSLLVIVHSSLFIITSLQEHCE